MEHLLVKQAQSDLFRLLLECFLTPGLEWILPHLFGYSVQHLANVLLEHILYFFFNLFRRAEIS